MNDEPNSPGTAVPKGEAFNHASWIGLVLAFIGSISYFLYFARYPAFRDFPWINLPLVALGLIFCARGVRHAFLRPGGLGKAAASVSLLLSLGFTGLFVFYVFILSYRMPPETVLTRTLTTAPDFTLPDQFGKTVTLSTLRDKRVVLAFYRGYW